MTKEQFSLVKENLDSIIELQTKLKDSLEQSKIIKNDDPVSVIEGEIDSLHDEILVE